MISQLRGLLIAKQPPLLILDVAGVGYELFAPVSTFDHLPELQQTVTLLTHLIVREDAHLLYGFYCSQERDLFRTLIKVSGIGPKSALSILSSITPHELVQCIHNHDISQLVNIPGIGKKTAERLIIETRDTLAHWQGSSGQQHIQDAISALTALGYKSSEAQQAVKQVQQHEQNQNSQTLIRLALQHIATGNR